MSSVSDDIAKQMLDSAPDMAAKTYNGAKVVVKDALGAGGKAIKGVQGICLILGKGTALTTKNVMNAVKKVALEKTGDIKFSAQNLDMSELQKSGKVSKVEDNITADVMKYFDKQCKRFSVKYAAMKDERDPANPSYMIFYNGKNSEIILEAMKEAYKDYIQDQQQGKEQGQGKGKKHAWGRKKETQPQERESIRAKLAFFRDRAAARDKEQGDVEKNAHRPEHQR